ncbi:MAG TPA: hypothetical protein DCY07_01735 [Rhodospirillaceae bacterium]|nr:hypothetical protein [Rhodospirillaceae bacterium]
MISFLLYPRARGGCGAPPVSPLFDYDFTSGVLPTGVTFSRSSSGTRFNASGVMVSEAIDAPRFDYDPVTHALRGLLIEPQRTNLLTASNSTGTTFHQVVTLDAISSPDGTVNGRLVADDLEGNSHRTSQTYVNYMVGNVYALSSHYKSGSFGSCQFVPASTAFGGTLYQNIDMANGAFGAGNISTGKTVQALADGWLRAAIVRSCIANQSYVNFVFGNNNNLNAARALYYTGTGGTYYLYGHQVEIVATNERQEATSHIPTTGSVVTRAAEVVGMPIPAGATNGRFVFDDASTQDVDVSAYAGGLYEAPVNLNRAHIQRFYAI